MNMIPHGMSGNFYRGTPERKTKMWSGAESNRRHEDFQSSALPTELPDHVKTNTLIKSMRQKSIIYSMLPLIIFTILLLYVNAFAAPSWEYYYSKANIQFNGEKYSFSIENYSRALELNPSLFDAANRLAEIYYIQEKKRESLDYYLLSLRINDRQPVIHNRVGEIQEFFGYYEKSLHHYKKSLESDPKSVDAHINLVRYYVRNNNRPEAEKHFNACHEAGKQKGDTLFSLARSEDMTGNTAAAIELYKKTILANPVDINAYFNLADIYRRQGRLMEAIEYLEKITRIKPDYEKAYIYLGQIYFTGKLPLRRSYTLRLATRNLLAAHEINPGNAETCHMLADIYSHIRDDINYEKYDSLARNIEASQQAKNPDSP